MEIMGKEVTIWIIRTACLRLNKAQVKEKMVGCFLERC